MNNSPQLPAVIPQQTTGLIVHPETVALLPVLAPAELVARRQELLQVVANVLREGEHFGVIPGSIKKNLLKPGAEILNQYFGFYAEFEIVNRVENWEAKPPLFDYEYCCTIRSKRDHSKVGEGVGSCNSYESKYRYREAKKTCPSCGTVGTIIKGKQEYGGGWVCWNKEKTACGAKFGDSDPAIVNQTVGKVDNEDIASQKNTILKMASKRAYVDATLKATGASELFTQDLEDTGVIDAEIVVQAVQEQNQERKEERAKGKSARNATSNNAAAAPAENSGQQDPGKNSASAGNADPKSVNTSGQSVAQEQGAKAASGSASNASSDSNAIVGAEQMQQLLHVAKGNGWTDNMKTSSWLCFAFGMTPADMLQKFTWKNWEIAIGLLQRPENANHQIKVNREGKTLAADKQWPQEGAK